MTPDAWVEQKLAEQRRLLMAQAGLASPVDPRAEANRHMIPTNFPEAPLVPLSSAQSFTSAKSEGKQSWYAGAKGDSPAPVQGHETEPGVEGQECLPASEWVEPEAVDSPRTTLLMEVRLELQRMVTLNEELSNTVTELQGQVYTLEIHMSDVQLRMQEYDLAQEISPSTQHYGIGTPRDQAAQDAEAEWYGCESLPGRVNDLTAYGATAGVQANLHVAADAGVPSLTGSAQNQLPVENPRRSMIEVLSDQQVVSTGDGGQHVTEVIEGGDLVPLPTDSDVFSFLAGRQPQSSSVSLRPTEEANPGRPYQLCLHCH
jgi:hypothetical protein